MSAEKLKFMIYDRHKVMAEAHMAFGQVSEKSHKTMKLFKE